jgi:NhaP-type Na+/H+ or K+/H+ antiporter
MHSLRSLLALSLGVRLTMESPGTSHQGRRVHWLVILLAVGVALDLLIGLALGYVAVQARSASSQAHIARVANYESCLVTNQRKAADALRWMSVLALVSQVAPQTQLQTFVAGVQKANALADQPQDCHKAVP